MIAAISAPGGTPLAISEARKISSSSSVQCRTATSRAWWSVTISTHGVASEPQNTRREFSPGVLSRSAGESMPAKLLRYPELQNASSSARIRSWSTASWNRAHASFTACASPRGLTVHRQGSAVASMRETAR